MARTIKNLLFDNFLLISTIIGVTVGFITGFSVREADPSESALMWIGLPGQLYLRLLKMMIVPLIVCSVVTGAASLDPKANGKISLLSLIFIIAANATGAIIGICSIYLFNPGKDTIGTTSSNMEGGMQTEDIIADLIRNIIPDNLFEATFAQTQTVYKLKDMTNEKNTNVDKNKTVNQARKYLEKTGESNILGLIFACTLLGLAAGRLGAKGRLFLDLIESVSDTVVFVVRLFLWTTPLGVISLIAVSLASAENIGDVFSRLGMFIAAVTVGIVFQQLVLMSGIYILFTRRNPFRYLISIGRPWMISFASTTTAVAIPEMLAACEDKNHIDKRVTRFVIPFSVTINRSGSALYIAGATVFVANLTGTALDIGNILLIWLLVTVVAMAIPAVPSASIMTTITVLTALNIPVDDVALLVAVEWYLDRLRSTGNIVSHTVCAAVIWTLCKKDLEEIDKKHRSRYIADEIIQAEDEVEMVVESSSKTDEINQADNRVEIVVESSNKTDKLNEADNIEEIVAESNYEID